MYISKKMVLVGLIVFAMLALIGATVNQVVIANSFTQKVDDYRASWEVTVLRENIAETQRVRELIYVSENCDLVFDQLDFNEENGEQSRAGKPVIFDIPLDTIGAQAEELRNNAPSFSSPLSFVPGISDAASKSQQLYNDLEAVRAASELSDESLYCREVQSHFEGNVSSAVTIAEQDPAAFTTMENASILAEEMRRELEFFNTILPPALFVEQHENLRQAFAGVINVFDNKTGEIPVVEAGDIEQLTQLVADIRAAFDSIGAAATTNQNQIDDIQAAADAI